ncbi:MAG: rhomboid family intramembrane serine protease [bacterium]|nr:rhomboid family intramembrane serine protease [bacterium]
MIMPIGTELPSLKRLPWITIAIIIANLVTFLIVGMEGRRVSRQTFEKLETVINYWHEHPYLDLPPEFIEDAIGEDEQVDLALMIASLQEVIPPGAAPLRTAQQQQLNALVEEFVAVYMSNPYFSTGLIPSRVNALAIFKSMFMHGGWMHLIGNMLWLWVTAPLLERALGRWLFPVFYALSGIAAALIHVGAQPGSTVPLIGASGAVAGLMGAFIIRFSDVKIRFVYWVFFIVTGTFRARAWIMLLIWITLQLISVLIVGTEGGVAYWAHIGGFAFGAAVAYALKLTRFEERFRPEHNEPLSTVSTHSSLEDGMKAIQAGNPILAREAFEQVLQDEPNHQDAHLGIWKATLLDGKPKEGAGNLIKAIEEELRQGDSGLALMHWRELLSRTGQPGPAPIRFKLGTALQKCDGASAMEVFVNLAEDPDAGLLAVKAMGRVADLAPTDEDRQYWEQRMADANLQNQGAQSGMSTPPPPQPQIQEVHVEPAPPTALQPLIQNMQPMSLTDDSVSFSGANTEMLPFSSISAVAVAAIMQSPKPYLLIDLVLAPTPDQPRCVVRMESLKFDPRRVLERSDLKPMDAFKELVRKIAGSAGVPVVPREAAAGKLTRYESVDAYRKAVLDNLL